MNHFIRDLLYGCRMIRRHPGSSLMAIIALAMGIGLVATMTSILDTILFAKFPFKEADRIYVVQWERDPSANLFTGTRSHDFEDFAATQTSFDLFGAARIGTTTISRDDMFATTINSMAATPDVFEMGGVQPARGRAFTDADSAIGAEPVVLISDSLWVNNFQSDPEILGQTLRLDGQSATIIGVMPPGWKFPFNQEIWRPLILDTSKEKRGSADPLIIFCRLAEGVTRGQADAEFDTIAVRLAEEYPDSNREYQDVDIQPLGEFIFNRTTHILLWTMMAAVILVLVVACANVANIILGQSALRLHELAVRNAMGASRRRLVTQMLTETFVLAAAGAVAGFLIVNWSIALLWTNMPSAGMPYWLETGFRVRHFIEILVIAAVATALSGLMPALKSSGANLREALQDSSRTASGFTIGRISRVLVVLQVALSCGLLIASLFMIRMTGDLTRIPFPFDPSKILTARLSVGDTRITMETDLSDYLALERLRENLEKNPDIAGVGFTSAPGLLYPWNSRFRIEGEDYVSQEDAAFAFNEVVSENYFETLGLNLIRGRLFEPTDTPDTERVIVVNTRFAEAHWPGEDPLGKRIKDIWKEEFPWMTVVGVVSHMGRGDNIPGVDGGCIYQFMGQAPQNASTVFIRTEGDPKALTGFLRDQVRLDLPGTGIDDTVTIEEMADRNNAGLVFLTSLFSSFGIAAVFLAAVGLYGVVSAAVAQRAIEIGVRMALGATPKSIVTMLMRQGLIQVSIGIVLGLLLGWTLNRVLFLAFQLPGEIPTLGHFIYVPVFLMAVALLALAMPSIRAARMSPMQAIREE